MPAMEGVILSHTRMGATGSGFCTNILVFPADGSAPYQIRPRLPPNSNLYVSTFGFTEAFMDAMWQPGYRVKVDNFVSVDPAHRRPTHPEDVTLQIVQHWHPLHYQVAMPPGDYLKTIQTLTLPNVQMIYPPLIRKSNGKAYVTADTELVRSVGYVVPKSVVFYQDHSTWNGTTKITERVKLTDATGVEYDFPLKDTQAEKHLQQGAWKRDTAYRFSAVRLALAGPIPSNGECYVMVSHCVP